MPIKQDQPVAIECVNTIEIRLPENAHSAFVDRAQAYLADLQHASGCADYTLIASSNEAGLWWLTGYWESASQMSESFESAAIKQLINCLIETGASLSFGSFVCQPGMINGD